VRVRRRTSGLDESAGYRRYLRLTLAKLRARLRKVPRTVERNTQVIRKLASGQYRLYSKKKDPKTGKRRNLGTFRTRAAAEKHERQVQYFKRRG
jgi:hypothetical protein